jgi:hypothetical protein
MMPSTTALGREIRVEAPASESMLSNFDIALTPSTEVMQASQQLMSVLSDPQAFSQWATQTLRQPDGVTALAAVFSDLISRGQAQQLATAINTAFATPTASQTFGSQAQLSVGGAPAGEAAFLPFTAYSLAIVDQMTRGNVQQAGESIWWAMSGAGGQQLADATASQLVALQARIGCSDPLRAAFRFAGQTATQQMSGATTGGMAGASNASPQTFVTNFNNVPSLWACFQDAYSQAQQLMTQGGAAGGAQQPTTGTTGTTQPSTGTTTAGQP